MSLIDYLMAVIIAVPWGILIIVNWQAQTMIMKQLGDAIPTYIDGHRQARAARDAYRKAMKDAGEQGG